MIEAAAIRPEFTEKTDVQTTQATAQPPSPASNRYESDFLIAREYGGTQYAEAVVRGQTFEMSS